MQGSIGPAAFLQRLLCSHMLWKNKEMHERCAGTLSAWSLYGLLATGQTKGLEPYTVVLPVLAAIDSERKLRAALSGEHFWLLVVWVFLFDCLVGASRSLLKCF